MADTVTPLKSTASAPTFVRERVLATLGQRILSSHYPPGSTLPTEAQLCAEFGVSRTAMREAIKMLAAKGLVVSRHERVEVPAFFWPLLVYAGLTLVSAVFSLSPRTSLADTKQLVLLLLVPVVCRLAGSNRSVTVLNVIVTVGALSALFGIVQYGVLEYNNLGRRPQGAMGHYMTYSGLLMLVAAWMWTR